MYSYKKTLLRIRIRPHRKIGSDCIRLFRQRVRFNLEGVKNILPKIMSLNICYFFVLLSITRKHCPEKWRNLQIRQDRKTDRQEIHRKFYNRFFLMIFRQTEPMSICMTRWRTNKFIEALYLAISTIVPLFWERYFFNMIIRMPQIRFHATTI